MHGVLPIGLLFWIVVVFLGLRKVFTDGQAALCKPLSGIKQRVPKGLIIAAVVCFCLSGYFCYLENAAIKEYAGVIGPRFFIAFVFGILGAITLSAHIFLKNPQA